MPTFHRANTTCRAHPQRRLQLDAAVLGTSSPSSLLLGLHCLMITFTLQDREISPSQYFGILTSEPQRSHRSDLKSKINKKKNQTSNIRTASASIKVRRKSLANERTRLRALKLSVMTCVLLSSTPASPDPQYNYNVSLNPCVVTSNIGQDNHT